jgi:hypothetical protein
MRLSMILTLLLFACGGSSPATSTPVPPSEKPSGGAAKPAAAASPYTHMMPSLIASRRNPAAPAELDQFGRLAGAWSCTSEQRQPDGSFKKAPGTSTWTFFYTLEGYAVADLFEPANPKATDGLNLRIFDPEAKRWRVTWWRHPLAGFDHYEATRVGDTIVMRGDHEARGKFPAHQARITFHHIAPSAFQWRYEAASPGSDQWRVFARMSCSRKTSLKDAGR